MILILSNSTDETTDLVCNYLYFFKTAFVRLNLDNDFVEGIVYRLSNLNSDLKLTLSTGKTIYYEKKSTPVQKIYPITSTVAYPPAFLLTRICVVILSLRLST